MKYKNEKLVAILNKNNLLEDDMLEKLSFLATKSDSQVQRLLRTREDIFPRYDQMNFESEFSVFFKIKKKPNCWFR
jgi:hypothetical protein